MNKKQIKTWNTLRFGNCSPDHVRQHLIQHWRQLFFKHGFNVFPPDHAKKTFARESECLIWVPENNKQCFFTYDDKDDVAFINFNYIKELKCWTIVDQEDHDLELHIGWHNHDQKISYGLINGRYNKSDPDSCYWTISHKNDNAKDIALAISSDIHTILMEKFDPRKINTRWVEKL